MGCSCLPVVLFVCVSPVQGRRSELIFGWGGGEGAYYVIAMVTIETKVAVVELEIKVGYTVTKSSKYRNV